VEVIEKKFCYVLDTSIKVLVDNPFLLEYPVMIIECTFLLDDEIAHAVNKKHVHWLQLKPYVINNPNVLFILTHFSFKYRDSEIREFFDNVKKIDNIKNIHPWLTDPVVDSNVVTVDKQELERLKKSNKIYEKELEYVRESNEMNKQIIENLEKTLDTHKSNLDAIKNIINI